MERYELGVGDRLAALVEAAERGDEAVITRNGTVIAEIKMLGPTELARSGVINLDSLYALHASLPPGVSGSSDLVRQMRDLDHH